MRLSPAAYATSAICMGSGAGMSTCSRTASPAIPMVSAATMTSVSASVPRAARRRPSAPRWPSWQIAVAGASVPVASAIATGKDSITAITGEPSGPVTGAWPWVRTGWLNSRASMTTAMTMNSGVITANTSRPPCPNQVRPATPASRAIPSRIRKEARAGR
jgi:hypothetical protein